VVAEPGGTRPERHRPAAGRELDRSAAGHPLTNVPTGSDSMKAYLLTTGSLFALLALAHLLLTIAEWPPPGD